MFWVHSDGIHFGASGSKSHMLGWILATRSLNHSVLGPSGSELQTKIVLCLSCFSSKAGTGSTCGGVQESSESWNGLVHELCYLAELRKEAHFSPFLPGGSRDMKD